MGNSFLVDSSCINWCSRAIPCCSCLRYPKDVPIGQQGLMRADHFPGDIGFDPLGLKPEDPEEFEQMVTKELQNGRLAMLAAAGFMAQELADGKGIIEHFQG